MDAVFKSLVLTKSWLAFVRPNSYSIYYHSRVEEQILRCDCYYLPWTTANTWNYFACNKINFDLLSDFCSNCLMALQLCNIINLLVYLRSTWEDLLENEKKISSRSSSTKIHSSTSTQVWVDVLVRSLQSILKILPILLHRFRNIMEGHFAFVFIITDIIINDKSKMFDRYHIGVGLPTPPSTTKNK